MEMQFYCIETPESKGMNGKDARIKAVFSILFKASATNEPFFTVVDFTKIGTQISMQASNQLKSMIQTKLTSNGGSLKYYTYAGSLTSPNCDPIAHHFILADVFNIGTPQLTALQTSVNGNYRATLANQI